MTKRAPKRLSLRATGMIVALGVFLIACGLIGLLAVWNRSSPGAGPAGPLTKAPPVMPPTPVNVTDTGLPSAGRARVQFVAKDDPNRAIGHLGWASLEPTGAGRAIVMEPKGEVYLRDGASVRISAAKGTIHYPAGLQQLESGSFDGGVTVELVPGGQADEKAPATLRIFTPSLNFSAVTGEVATLERFRASSEQFDIIGRGLRLVGNQVEGALALLQIDEREYAVLAPQRGSKHASGGRTPDAPGATAAGSGREVFYHAMLREHVRIIRRATTVGSDRLEAWARVVNGALVPGAIGAATAEPGAREAREARGGEAKAATVAMQVSEPPALPKPIPGEPETLFTGRADPELIQVVWEGPFQIAPLAARPVELQGEEVAVAFRSERETPVSVTDGELHAGVTASSISYGVTSRTLGVSTGATPGRLFMAEKGELRLPAGSSAEINLGTGIGTVRGAELVSGDSTPEKPKSISWTEQATIAMSTRDGSIGDKLREATFKGGVVAREGESFLKADSAKAVFAGFQRPGGPLESLLSRVEAEGHVEAQESGGGFLRGDSLALAMEYVGRTSNPHELMARGNVRAGRDGWTIGCGELDATLDRSERGEVVVTSATARKQAVVEGRGVVAKADEINADVAHQLVTFVGESASLSKDGGTISGKQMQLTGDRGELFVFGPGKFTMTRDPRTPGATPVNVTAVWDKSFSFNNIEGKAEAVGGASVVSTPSALEEERLTASTIKLWFTPGKASDLRLGEPETAAKMEAEDRELLRAEAIGESQEREGGARASVESIRFATGGGPVGMPGNEAERPIERQMFVEGDRLIADSVSRTIEVPGEGKALMDDRRVAATPAGGIETKKSASPLPADLGGARGTTLFHWKQGLKFTRDDGKVALLGGVRVLHRDTPTSPVLLIESDSASATLRTSNDGKGKGGGDALLGNKQAELLSASCEGHVVSTLPGGGHLTADSAKYDAGGNTIEAGATGDGFVTYTEPSDPIAKRARKIIWDLMKQQARVVEPAPVVVPR